MILEHGALWRGQHFGEHSLLLRCLRMHGVAAAAPVELLVLNKARGRAWRARRGAWQGWWWRGVGGRAYGRPGGL